MDNLESQFVLRKINYAENLKGEILKTSPSNIALIKYWGKYERQIPANASLSFSLTRSFTETKISYRTKEGSSDFSLKFFFEKKENDFFGKKIWKFFELIFPFCPYLKNFDFTIFSSNTFPHSSGIASSASSMSALALCLVELEKKMGYDFKEKESLERVSFLARIGSGSACRSVYPGFVVWGRHKKIRGSNDFYGISYPYEIHENFKDFQDTILIVEAGTKSISSSKGHELMKNHPFAKARFKQANKNLSHLIPILKEGTLDSFGELIESEALSLHSLMMASNPYFILMKPSTLTIIEKVWAYRKDTNKNLFFTLDAGANVHLLYPNSQKQEIFEFISKELISYCQNKSLIRDFISS